MPVITPVKQSMAVLILTSLDKCFQLINKLSTGRLKNTFQNVSVSETQTQQIRNTVIH